MREFMERFFGENPPVVPRQGQPSPRPNRAAVGSGFIVDPAGYVVTNHHVTDEAEVITVTLADGESYDAALIGSDPRTDLALLKIEAERPLPTVAFGDSDGIRPGDWVLAVGNPFGLGGTVTAGIVSARGRDLPGGALIDYLQIDAPINRGNSGGPAFDVEGKVIGVNTAIYSPTGGSVGIGFAIPSNLAERVIAELRETGSVERGWLGVQVQPVSPDIAEGLGLPIEAGGQPRGALIAALVEDGPAEDAGLQPGDVILAWDGQPVEALRDLPRLVAATPVDEQVEVEIWRDRASETLSVLTGRSPETQQLALARPERDGSGNAAAVLPGTGLSVAALDDRTRARFDIPSEARGVVVTDVEPNSPAERQGLRAGDVIASIALTEVASPEQARDAIEAIRESDTAVATLMITRNGEPSFIALRLAQV